MSDTSYTRILYGDEFVTNNISSYRITSSSSTNITGKKPTIIWFDEFEEHKDEFLTDKDVFI